MRSEFEPAPWDILGQGRKRKKEEIKRERTYTLKYFLRLTAGQLNQGTLTEGEGSVQLTSLYKLV
jgi:hypothetical protein